MKHLIAIFVAVMALAVTEQVAAQIPSCLVNNSVKDGSARGSSSLPYKRSVPPAYVREADVMWLKRVWRRIDLREKINHPMYFPLEPLDNRLSLFDALKCAITDGTIVAYDPGPLGDDDMFTYRMTTQEVGNILYSTDTAWTDDIETGEPIPVIVTTEISSQDVKLYDIKEEWFFDRQRSVMDVRIIGICPLVEKRDTETGEFRGYKPLFWIYYPHARTTLAHFMAFNQRNTMAILSYDDLFTKRHFGSVIIKESNVYDRSISEYKTGIDALLEADRVKDDIFIMEHDLWSY